MSESTANNQIGDPKDGDQKVEKVELAPETYNALLERLEELEEAASSTGTPQATERSTLDELADEGRTTRTADPREPGKNLDDMSNTEQTQYIVDEINRQAGDKLNKVEVAVETLRVLREIDKTEAKHDDFWQYENEVKELTMANPSMSIEDAYLLAKQKNPKSKDDKGEEGANKTTRTERMLNLPSRAAHGEKPGVAVSTTVDSNPSGKTLRSAAEKAWEESVGKEKPEV